MGPVLRAEVGDTIVVHFWNKATRPVTMHPHVSPKQFIINITSYSLHTGRIL